MKKETKLQWVFDGARDEFWMFAGLTVLSLLRLLWELRNLFWGYHDLWRYESPGGMIWIEWMAVVAFSVFAVSFYLVERLLGVACLLTLVHFALKLAVHYHLFPPDRLIPIGDVFAALATVFMLLGCAMYLKHRLRREPALNAQTDELK